MKATRLSPFITLVAAAMLAACESESYDAGDSSYSYMQADLCEVATDDNCTAQRITLDDDTEWTLSTATTADWLQRPDTLYRALVYYNEVATSQGEPRMEVVAIDQVPVTRPIDKASVKEMKTDAVDVVSLWKSKNGKYLNFRIQLKTGKADDDAAGQSLALVETARLSNFTSTMSSLTLYHDQGDIPQYYSQTVIFSMPLSAITADSLTVNIQTYDGMFTRKFSCK